MFQWSLTFLGIFAFIGWIINIIWYVFKALGLMMIGQKLNYTNSWFAWIPGASGYMLGELAQPNLTRRNTQPNFIFDNIPVILAILEIANLGIGFIPFIDNFSWLTWVGYTILRVVAAIVVFRYFVPESSLVGFIILYVLVPPVALMIIGNRQVMPDSYNYYNNYQNNSYTNNPPPNQQHQYQNQQYPNQQYPNQNQQYPNPNQQNQQYPNQNQQYPDPNQQYQNQPNYNYVPNQTTNVNYGTGPHTNKPQQDNNIYPKQ